MGRRQRNERRTGRRDVFWQLTEAAEAARNRGQLPPSTLSRRLAKQPFDAYDR